MRDFTFSETWASKDRRFSNGHIESTHPHTSSSAQKSLLKDKKDRIEKITSYYAYKHFIQPEEIEEVNLEKLTNPDYDLAVKLREVLVSEKLMKRVEPPEVPVSNVQIREMGLKRDLYEAISTEPDGQKIFGGDNQTIKRWQDDQKNIFKTEQSLSNTLMSQKRKVLTKFLIKVNESKNAPLSEMLQMLDEENAQ